MKEEEEFFVSKKTVIGLFVLVFCIVAFVNSCTTVKQRERGV